MLALIIRGLGLSEPTDRELDMFAVFEIISTAVIGLKKKDLLTKLYLAVLG